MRIFAAVLLCALTGAAPVWSQTTVESRARQIFANAAKRYGAVRTLQLRWKDHANEQFENGGDVMGFVRGSVAFDRRGLLRWQSTSPASRYSLVVVDGKDTSMLVSEMVNLRPYPVYERASTGRQKALEQLSERGEWFSGLAQWLQGRSPLRRGTLARFTREAKVARYSARALPSAKFNNQSCDLVRINMTYRDKKFLQETYWFRKNGGELVRVQRKKSAADEGDDIRIEAQKFNLKLAPTTFRFVPPRRARLVKSG